VEFNIEGCETLLAASGFSSGRQRVPTFGNLVSPPVKTFNVMPRRTVLSRRRRSGFTLLELLLVLAILVMLVGVVGVNLSGTQSDANVGITTTQISNLKNGIDMYRIRMNVLPDTLDQLRDGPSDSEKKAKWTAPIMTDIPADAWGNAFVYKKNGNAYEIRSAGLDGQVNTDDDIVVEGT
jgi:general secretion pathway protein G